MSNVIKNFLNLFVTRETSAMEKIELVSMLGIIFSIFFPIRYVILSSQSKLLGFYSDFTSISIYFSFLFILIFISVGIIKQIKASETKILIKGILILIGGLLLYQLNLDPSLKIISGYFYLKFICALLLGYYVYKSNIWLKYKKFFLWTSVYLGAIQAIIAIFQFAFQHSIGLNILGESPLQINLFDVAKIVSHGTSYIRGYGTLPHPNILGGILVVISLLNLYLLNNTKQILTKYALSLAYFLITIGVFITFSRAAILSFIVSTTWYFLFYAFITKFSIFIRKFWIVPVSILFSILVLFPWLNSRNTLTDSAVGERSIYNQVGLSILRQNWFIGTGPGTNLFHMEQKLRYSLDYWNIQPIHNYWLILLNEFGIIGLIIGIFILLSFYKIFTKSLKINPAGDNWALTLSAISISIFILFWFDHYFYTIWPAQILLWIIIGLVWKGDS